MNAGDRSVTCCFTGHRPERLDQAETEAVRWRLHEAVERAIRDGYTYFISGMSRGVDLYAAQAVLDLKEEHPGVVLEAALPCMQQADRWNRQDQAEYRRLLMLCDVVNCLSPEYTKNCMILRDRYMVERSGRVIAYYNGAKTGGTAVTVQMAKRAGIEIVNLYGEEK